MTVYMNIYIKIILMILVLSSLFVKLFILTKKRKGCKMILTFPNGNKLNKFADNIYYKWGEFQLVESVNPKTPVKINFNGFFEIEKPGNYSFLINQSGTFDAIIKSKYNNYEQTKTENRLNFFKVDVEEPCKLHFNINYENTNTDNAQILFLYKLVSDDDYLPVLPLYH